MIFINKKAICVFCSKNVVLRTSSVKRHFETNHEVISQMPLLEQKEYIAQFIKNQEKMTSKMLKHIGKNEITGAASFHIANLIAKSGKPFQDGEFIKAVWLECAPLLFKDFENKDKIIQQIKEIPLSRNTIKERIFQLAKNISSKQILDLKKTSYLSLCLDESTDITKSARLAVFARYCVDNKIKEELIGLLSLQTTTKGSDINLAVKELLQEKDIDIKKIVSITTDGAPSMVGKQNGFVNLFRAEIGHEILEFHCIIHQQALCAKNGLIAFNNIMILVTKIINLISAHALNKRKFDNLLNEAGSFCSGLLMYNNVRWLSRGCVLKRFIDCLQEIQLFIKDEEKMNLYPEIYDKTWLMKLMFFTDFCLHLNDLNVKL